MSGWETVIGLEVHARLQTDSKLFCGCSTAYGAPPNAQVCPICLGYPGALPVLNRRAVELAVLFGLATGSTIHPESAFARKNYFYPDLPKGYQISQFDRPIVTGGSIEVRVGDQLRSVRLTRIHIEEDAGKSLHDTPWDDVPDNVTLIDLNRAGTPLIEIISEPDIRSAEEAVAYLGRLRQMLVYAGVCDGNMEEGSLRCDANVSVRKPGGPFGTRSEVKNLNSFRFLARAIEFETERQIERIEAGESVVQETRLFDPARGETRSMRSKEEAHDYRYFPEPDLPPLVVTDELVDRMRRELPEMPGARSRRFQEELALSAEEAETIVAQRALAEYFELAISLSENRRGVTNWIKNDVMRVLNERKLEITQFKISPTMLVRLIELIDTGAINGKAAKEVFEDMIDSGEAPDAIVERKGLGQISDPERIREAARRVIAASAAQVEQFKSGKSTLFGFFVGQLMKETRGKANPELANEIIRELLDE
jgi:aspartyl-tRNA(Asn)/glutamyl-tRNA(Gln) amidotransferase subunit B